MRSAAGAKISQRRHTRARLCGNMSRSLSQRNPDSRFSTWESCRTGVKCQPETSKLLTDCSRGIGAGALHLPRRYPMKQKTDYVPVLRCNICLLNVWTFLGLFLLVVLLWGSFSLLLFLLLFILVFQISHLPLWNGSICYLSPQCILVVDDLFWFYRFIKGSNFLLVLRRTSYFWAHSGMN